MRATANEPPAEHAEPETQDGVEATEDSVDDAACVVRITSRQVDASDDEEDTGGDWDHPESALRPTQSRTQSLTTLGVRSRPLQWDSAPGPAPILIFMTCSLA
jgi:hypothetical protein